VSPSQENGDPTTELATAGIVVQWPARPFNRSASTVTLQPHLLDFSVAAVRRCRQLRRLRREYKWIVGAPPSFWAVVPRNRAAPDGVDGALLGYNVKQDEAAGLARLQGAAARSDAAASAFLATQHASGLAVPQDWLRARSLMSGW